MTFNNEDVSINSIIGLGSTISGDIKVNGFVRIDGDIDGNLETTGNIIVGEKARIQGNVVARSITVGGVIKGNITASDSVDLLATSIVLGDICTRRLQADENVVFHGHCIALTKEDDFNTAVTKWQNMQTITSHSILESVHVSHVDVFRHVPLPKSNTAKTDSFVEETVQDITISQNEAASTNTIPTEAIPVEAPAEKTADENISKPIEEPAPADNSQSKPTFVPINLGDTSYSPAPEQHSESETKKE